MVGSILTDDCIDAIPIFYWIRSKSDDHIWVLTRSMDMDMSVPENGLEYAGDLSIDLLDTIQTTFRDTTGEWW